MLLIGLSLRDLPSEKFTWADFAAFIAGLTPDSALIRQMAINGDTRAADMLWSREALLTAAAVDELRFLRWGLSGGKAREKPQLIPRPGVNQDKGIKQKHYGSGAMSIEQAIIWREARRRGETPCFN